MQKKYKIDQQHRKKTQQQKQVLEQQRQKDSEQQQRALEQQSKLEQQRQRDLEQQPPPPGFTLQHTLRGHTGLIAQIAWSPNGSLLASASGDRTIRLWDIQSAQPLSTLRGHVDRVYSVAWSPDGRLLASASNDQTIRLWDVQSLQELSTLTGHSASVRSVAWSPDGSLLASASDDQTIHVWDGKTGQHRHTLEGHTASISRISFSADNQLLASKSVDATVRLWNLDTWQEVAILNESSSGYLRSGVTFHRKSSLLATLGEEDTVIRIWDLDFETILRRASVTSSVHYTNAKVVLVGDSGVGKSGLGLVLTGQPFALTSSTHARQVWTFDSQSEVVLAGGHKETRETLLWDLAGQPGYRLIHQLYLNEVAVALVVFDARSETDPFAGIYHWHRALRQAERIQGSAVPRMKKFLVAARLDRGSIGVSRTRIDAFKQELGFDGYFETSAMQGWGIEELGEAIRQAIDWESLPKGSSNELFQRIKEFLLSEKENGHLLATASDLYHAFMQSENKSTKTESLQAEFATCIGLVELRGLIRRLSFGGLVLLQPELLDAYASALINAVKDEPDGFGSIAEEKVRRGNFLIPAEERIQEKEQEKLLLLAMIEDMIRYEVALHEQDELVFPAQTTRENPELPDPEGKTVVFGFEGPVLNVYATLVVRLARSSFFRKKELWKNAATYTVSVGGTCGLHLHDIFEGKAKLTLFFDKDANEQTRFQFEEYVRIHLQRRALPESITRERIFVCHSCSFVVTQQLVRLRSERGFNWVACPVCGMHISLLDREERLTTAPSPVIQEMDRSADIQRDRETARSIIQGKIKTSDFDVFLCHNMADKPAVKKIGEQLKEQGILPWLDEWELRPGLPWQGVLGEQIEKIKSAAVFVGRSGTGPWQQRELEAFLSEFVSRSCPVIPVLLADAPKEPHLPIFLRGITWVDFRKCEPEPMKRLIWGITGERVGVGFASYQR